MGDFFRSAMNYLSQASSGVASSGRSHPLVGTTIKIANVSYRIRSLLAEGGYALVFAAQDAQENWFALKRQLAVDRNAADAIIKEINFMKELSGHPNIVQFVQATRQEMKDSPGRMEFFMVMEMCTGGPLIDLLQKEEFVPEQICKILYSVCNSVQHMHDRSPPITHRDIKIENLLFDARGFIRLCDFGSATTEIFRPDDSWSVSKRNLLEEEMAKYTTPMYRAPEILDTYQNYPIGPAQDIWALGCILYYLCYRQHPFEDSAKLRIINAKFTLPDADNTPYAMFHSIIRSSLQPNPYSRPAIGDMCDQIRELARMLQINLDEPILSVSNTTEPIGQDCPLANNASQQQNYPNTSTSGAQPASSEMFAQLKGQGLSLFKNIKDKSSIVMQNVQLGTSLLISGYAAPQNGAAQPSSAGRRPSLPPVPPPPQQRQPRSGFVPPVPPPPDFFAEHPQQQSSRSGAVRGPPPPSPPHSHRGPSPRVQERPAFGENARLCRSSGPTPPPVPPHHGGNIESRRDERRYFEQTHEDGYTQSRHDVGLGAAKPLTPPIDYITEDGSSKNKSENSSTANVAEADFLGLGESSEPNNTKDVDSTSKPKFNNTSEIFDPFHMFSDGVRFNSTSDNNTNQHFLGGSSINSLSDAHQRNNNFENILSFGGGGGGHLEKNMSASSMIHQEVDDLLVSHAPARNVSVPNFTKSGGANDGTRGLVDDFLLLDTSDKTPTMKPTTVKNDSNAGKKEFDPFGEFLANMAHKDNKPNTQAKSEESRPSYNRAYFETPKQGGVPKAPPPASAFDDILSSQGFSASSKQANRTLADLQREENIKEMDPITIKIRDWTNGKERNIRALLGSLSDVLWDGVEGRWTQPSMSELLTHVQIKKQYRKACLVVHPDKQTGTSNELLAKAIFTELNDAWNTFEESRN